MLASGFDLLLGLLGAASEDHGHLRPGSGAVGGKGIGAAPMTFHVEKRTFRADGHARRGKAVTINPRTCKSCPGAPPGP